MRCCPDNKLKIMRSNAKKIPFDAIKLNMASVDALLREMTNIDAIHSEQERFNWARRLNTDSLHQAELTLTQHTQMLNNLLLGPDGVGPTEQS